MPKKPVDKSFGKRLTLLRKQRGLTMSELAKRLGVDIRSVFYYEKQSKQPPSHLLAQLSKELRVSVEEILGIKPVKTFLDPADASLWRNFQRAKVLPKEDRRAIVQYINALLAKHRRRRS